MTGWIDFSASSEIPIGKNHLKQNFRLACREAVAQTAVVAVCVFSRIPRPKRRGPQTRRSALREKASQMSHPSPSALPALLSWSRYEDPWLQPTPFMPISEAHAGAPGRLPRQRPQVGSASIRSSALSSKTSLKSLVLRARSARPCGCFCFVPSPRHNYPSERRAAPAACFSYSSIRPFQAMITDA